MCLPISDSYCWFKSSNLIFTCCCTILLISFFPVSLLERPTKLYKTLHSKTVTSCHMLISEPDTWCGRRLPAGHSGTRSSHETGCNGQGLRKNAEGSWLSLRQRPMMIYESTIAYLDPLWSIMMVYHHGLSSSSIIMTHHDPWWSIMIYHDLSVCPSVNLRIWLACFFWVCAFKITNIGDS